MSPSPRWHQTCQGKRHASHLPQPVPTLRGKASDGPIRPSQNLLRAGALFPEDARALLWAAGVLKPDRAEAGRTRCGPLPPQRPVWLPRQEQLVSLATVLDGGLGRLACAQPGRAEAAGQVGGSEPRLPGCMGGLAEVLH